MAQHWDDGADGFDMLLKSLAAERLPPKPERTWSSHHCTTARWRLISTSTACSRGDRAL